MCAELESNPDYDKMISEAEHQRLSRGSSDGSTGSSRSAEHLESEDFVNKVCKFEMMSRGKVTSPTVKSPPAVATGGKLPSYFGEKVFSRDTATTRVPASVLHSAGDRVISTCSSVSSNSLTSVSTLSWSSDSSGSSRSLTSPPVTPQGTLSPGYSGAFSLLSPQGHMPQGFVTLGDRRPDGRGEPPPVVIRPAGDSLHHISSRPGMVNGDSSTSREGFGSIHSKEGSSVSSLNSLSVDDSGTKSSNRNTFEGMDFDLSQMTESEQELARRHREIVAERKRDQEQERLERQRLEEILRLCAEYQQEVESGKSGAEPLTRPTNVVTSTTTSSNLSMPNTKHPASPSSALTLLGGEVFEKDQKVLRDDHAQRDPQACEGERKTAGDHWNNVTKIKTNGSLILSSPSHTHKEGLFSYQMRRCESNSSTSEDEMLGSSEDTGTIKRRPQHPDLPEELTPTAESPNSVNIFSKVSVSSDGKADLVPVRNGTDVVDSSSVTPRSSIYLSGQTQKDVSVASVSSVSKDSPVSPGQSRLDEILNSSFEAEREAAEFGGYGKFSVQLNAQVSRDDSQEWEDEEDSVHSVSKRSHSSTSSSKGSHSSASSCHTLQDHSPEVTDGKEGTPTPMNSDSEQVDVEVTTRVLQDKYSVFESSSSSIPVLNTSGHLRHAEVRIPTKYRFVIKFVLVLFLPL